MIKPLIHRLQREFNISVSEMGKLDVWNESIIMCGHISNSKEFSNSYTQQIEKFLLHNFKNLDILGVNIEFL